MRLHQFTLNKKYIKGNKDIHVVRLRDKVKKTEFIRADEIAR